MSPPLIRNKGVTAAAKNKETKKPPGPLSNDSSRSLMLPPSLNASENFETVTARFPVVAASSSSQTIESWPILEKRLNMFEKTKKKKDKDKTLTSTYVQAVPPPIKRANVKCLVYVEQGDKTTQVRIGPSGLERAESCVNTEKNDSNSGIQCDIALRRKTLPKRIASRRRIHFSPDPTQDDNFKPVDSNKSIILAAGPAKSEDVNAIASNKSNLTATDIRRDDLVTVLPSRMMEPRATRSENAYAGKFNYVFFKCKFLNCH